MQFTMADKKDPENIDYIDQEKREGSSPSIGPIPTHINDDELHFTSPPKSARELAVEVILPEDDPTLNPWTFRMWFLGISISVFSGLE